MPTCLFATDLHGRTSRYEKLFASLLRIRPAAVFLGGDLLPRGAIPSSDGESSYDDFVQHYLVPGFAGVRAALGEQYPRVFLILGNDDPRSEESSVIAAETEGIWEYVHGKKASLESFPIYGFACVPPTPFLLKDWERYDVSRYTPPGCISPEEGIRSVSVAENGIKWGTLRKDLALLVGDEPLDRTIFLFHIPPYETLLDRADLDGRSCEHVPVDVHVGSIAVREFIHRRQPLLTLHGHVHEAARLTGSFKIKIGRTVCLNGAHDGPELALVHFDPESPEGAWRELL